jgi:hypothetical protein
MESRNARLPAFLVSAVVIFIVTLAMFRLPDSYVSQVERDTPLSTSQAGWAYRLLAFAAIAQAIYGGFVILQVERVRKARSADPRSAAMTGEETVRTLARTGAGMVVLTLVYGVASFYVSGQRGGFWLFVVLAVAQGAWNYRQVGQVAKWVMQQPEVDTKRQQRPPSWQPEPPDYSPPLGR